MTRKASQNHGVLILEILEFLWTDVFVSQLVTFDRAFLRRGDECVIPYQMAAVVLGVTRV